MSTSAEESKTNWKTLIVPDELVEDCADYCYLLHIPNNHSSSLRHIYISKKLVEFIGDKKCKISYLPDMTWLAKGRVYKMITISDLERWFGETTPKDQ